MIYDKRTLVDSPWREHSCGFNHEISSFTALLKFHLACFAEFSIQKEHRRKTQPMRTPLLHSRSGTDDRHRSMRRSHVTHLVSVSFQNCPHGCDFVNSTVSYERSRETDRTAKDWHYIHRVGSRRKFSVCHFCTLQSWGMSAASFYTLSYVERELLHNWARDDGMSCTRAIVRVDAIHSHSAFYLVRDVHKPLSLSATVHFGPQL